MTLVRERRRRREAPELWAGPAPAPLRVGVVGPAALAAAFGGALALRLAGASGAPVALLASTRPADGPRASATAAATRAAGALGDRGLTARASGRLVRAALDGPAPDAAFVRAAAAVPGPAVLAVGDARTLGLDAALAGCDSLVLVAPPDDGSLAAGVAEASLAALGPPVHAVEVRPGLLARTLALAGLAAVEPLRSAADATLGGR